MHLDLQLANTKAHLNFGGWGLRTIEENGFSSGQSGQSIVHALAENMADYVKPGS